MPAPLPTPPPRGPARLAGLVAPLLAALMTGQPGIGTGAWLIGGGTADTWGHTWGYAWTVRALRLGELPFLRAPVAWPEPQRWWIIDLPVALLLAPVSALSSAALAYNLAFLLHLGLGAFGLARLLGHWGVPARVAALAGVLAALSPFSRGALVSGVPEALSVLLVPLLMLWLDRGLSGERRALLGAALLAPVLVLDGVYGALSGGLAGALVWGSRLWRAPARGPVLARGLAVALPAALATVGLRAALAFMDHPVLAQADGRLVDIGPHWTLQPLGGADLASLFVPARLLPVHPGPTAHRHIVYVGALLPLLVLGALARRRSRGLAALAITAATLCLGPVLYVWGQRMDLGLPGMALWAAGATNLYRLAGLAPVAGLGAAALWLRDRPRWAALALLLVGLEWTAGTPLRLRLPTTENPVGPVEQWLRDQPGPGAVLDLPFDREGSAARGPHPQRTFHLQSHHRRPVASGLYTEAPMKTAHPAIGAVDRALRAGWRLAEVPAGGTLRDAPPLPPAPRDQARSDLLATLAQARFRYLSLDLALVVPSQRAAARAWAEDWLGPPAVEADQRLAWALPCPGADPGSPPHDRATPHTAPPRPGPRSGPRPASTGSPPPPPPPPR